MEEVFAISVAKKNSKFKEINKIVEWLLNKEEIFEYNSLKKHVEF